MTQQALLVVFAGLMGALPGLTAIWLWKRKEHNERAQVDVQAKIRRHMQEQIDAQQQTIRFLARRLDELERSRAAEFAETEILRQEIEDLRQEVGELRRGVGVLSSQLKAADIPPAWSPPESPKRVKERPRDANILRQKLVEYFSLEDINDLAFQLNIEPDELSGSTKKTKARSLVSYMKDRERLEELYELMRSLRPGGYFE